MREAVCDGFKVVLIDGVESRFAVGIWKYEMIAIHSVSEILKSWKGVGSPSSSRFSLRIFTIHCPLTHTFQIHPESQEQATLPKPHPPKNVLLFAQVLPD